MIPEAPDLPTGKWKRNPLKLWAYALFGAARIIVTGISLVLIRRRPRP